MGPFFDTKQKPSYLIKNALIQKPQNGELPWISEQSMKKPDKDKTRCLQIEILKIG